MTFRSLFPLLNYSQSFESQRRIKPRVWDSDYCLLRGLAREIRAFAETKAAPGHTVVDYGCGAKPYRVFFPLACRYLGVDVCENPHADIVLRCGERVPLADASADLVLSTQVVYLVSDFGDYLAECRRLLKPGGWLLLTTHGTWTYHPASGGDYYRFTQDGVRHILAQSGFKVVALTPVVGTLGTGIHLRQLVFNSWLRRVHLGWLAAAYNVVCNVRIMLEDRLSPLGTRMSAPVIFCALAQVGEPA